MNPTELLSLLKPETAKIDAVMRHDLESVGSDLLKQVLEYAIFNGGKRIRPLLTILAARLCNKNQEQLSPETSDNLYRFSLTFEYLHAASLLHDDVIDRADKRRGQKTANTVWDNTHVILAGDFLHSRAMLLAGSLGSERSLQRVCQATSEMVESEFLQLNNAVLLDTSEDNYFKVLNGKTASLIAAACSSGALFTGGFAIQEEALELFGANLGVTFQIVDDLLDYLGNPAKTGKAVGNDFQEGKMTLPLIYTLHHAGTSDKKQLHTLLDSTGEQRKKSFAEAVSIIHKTNGFEYARSKADSLMREAVAALDIFTDCPAKSILIALTNYVLHRDK